MSVLDDHPEPATQELPPPAPALGAEGALCRACGTPLAVDQRYCLECGTRRGEARVPFAALPGAAAAQGAAVPEPLPAVEVARAAPLGFARAWTPMTGAIVAGAVGAAFGIGILIGVVSADPPPAPRVAAARAPVVNVTVPGGGGGGTSAPVSFAPDWPSGTDGYTVQLSTLPKDGTTPDQVAAAKSDATAKGTPDVGALDSDEYGSLDPGDYVIYSGVYDTRKEAKAALRDVRGDFADASVVHVSAGDSDSSGSGSGSSKDKKAKGKTVSKKELEAKQKLTPEQFQKQSKKLDKVTSEGKPPPIDKSKKPGGGGKAKTFG